MNTFLVEKKKKNLIGSYEILLFCTKTHIVILIGTVSPK